MRILLKVPSMITRGLKYFRGDMEFKTTFIIKFFPFHCVDILADGAKNDG